MLSVGTINLCDSFHQFFELTKQTSIDSLVLGRCHTISSQAKESHGAYFTRPVPYISLGMPKYLTKNPLELVHVPYSPLPTRYEDYHRFP